MGMGGGRVGVDGC
ncbi:unnamed protein product, partial [Rotaria sp. Silwood1]